MDQTDDRRSGRDRRRFRVTSTTVALWTLTVLLASALVLVFVYQARLRSVERSIYSQCVARQAYDDSSQRTRQAFLNYYNQYITDELENRFIDDRLRARRVGQARSLILTLSDTLGKSVRGGCNQYR